MSLLQSEESETVRKKFLKIGIIVGIVTLVLSVISVTIPTTLVSAAGPDNDTSLSSTNYEDTDNEFVPGNAPWGWVMTGASYKIGVKEDFTAGQILSFWSQDEAVILQPMALEWTNDYNMIQQVSMPQDVNPIITNPDGEGTITWDNAYGSGIDFEWKSTTTRLNKILTISGLNDLPPPAQYIQDGDNPVLRLNLIFAPSSGVDIYADGSLWNKSSKQQTFDRIEFRKDGEVLWSFAPLMYWDSEGSEGQSVATVEKRGNSLYISIRVPYEWLQSAVYPVYIDADIMIDANAYTSIYSRTIRGGPFWTSALIGYVIYLNATSDLVYRKTADGGATWSGATVVVAPGSCDSLIYDSYADWQTVGDAGTKIHIVYMSADTEEVRYVYLDTSDDSVGGDDLIETCQGTGTFFGAPGLRSFQISITKTRGGNFAVAFKYKDSGNNKLFGFYTSPDADTWTSKAAVYETELDRGLLFSGNEADSQDLWAAYWDQSTSTISLKTFDDSGDSWSEQSISGSMVVSTDYIQMDGQIRLSDGHLIFAAWSTYNAGTSDLKVWDINGAGSITAKTNIITDEAENFLVSVFVDQSSDDIYITYVQGTDATTLVKCSYKKSTNGGSAWGSEINMQADVEDDMRWISAGAMKAAGGGKFQPVWFDDDDNDLFTNSDNGISISIPDPPTNFAATENLDDKVTCTWTKSGDATKYQLYRDGAPVGAELGDVDTTDDATGTAGSITSAGTVTASDGTETAYVELSLAGESLGHTSYDYTVRAGNAVGWSGDSNTDAGYRASGAITYQWQVDDGGGYDNIIGGTTDPYNYTEVPGTITPGNAVATDHTHTDKVALNLAGESVADGPTYDYQCVLTSTGASNSPATSNNDTGYRTTGALTYQWQVDDGGGYDNIVGGTTEAYDYTLAPPPSITAGNAVATNGVHTDKVALSLAATTLNDGATYDYKCVLNATGTVEQTSGADAGETGGGALGYQWEVDRGLGWGNIGGAVASTYNDTAAPEGTISNNGIVTASVDETAHVTLSLAGEATTDGDTNEYRCSLTSADAAGQTSGSNTGYRTVGGITFAWQVSDADSDADYNPIGGGTTDPYNDATAPAGTVTPGIATASDGIAEAYVTLVVSGHSTAPGAGRYYKCIISSVGASNTPQTSNTNRGYRITGAITYTWERSDADADAAYNTQIGVTNPYNDVGAPANGDGRWYRALLDATGAAQAETTHDRGYRASSGYEQYTTGDDADGDDIYGVNWAGQQFTAGTVSHTVTSVLVKIKRVGSPGTITLSLREANAIYHPTGTDLAYGTLDGDTISDGAGGTWYEFDISGISLEASELYALVMRAPDGGAADYVEWRWDSGGGLDDAIASLSEDAGITWTVDAGGADYLFEIRGDSIIELIGAQVFRGYIEAGDWLIALTYINEYLPYYPYENPANYFHLQFLDGIVVKYSTNCLMWGYRPGSIYIAPELARTLEWGATDYTIRLFGDFGTNPASGYLLQPEDWIGSNLVFLDSWVITQAKAIGNDIGVTLVESVADLGEVLNEYGHTLFSIGIPQLNEVRPELFAMVTRTPDYEEEDYTHDLQGESDWETRLGPQIVEILNNAGDLIGQEGDVAGGIIVFIAFIGVFTLLSLFGRPVIGLGLGYPILIMGAWGGLVSWIIIGVITFLMAVVFVYKTFLVR